MFASLRSWDLDNLYSWADSLFLFLNIFPLYCNPTPSDLCNDSYANICSEMIIRLENRWRFNMLPWVLLNTFALWSFCGQYLSSNYLVIVAFSIHHNLSYACPVPCIFCRTKRSPRRVLSSRLKLPVRLSSSTVSWRRLRKYIVRSICFLTRTIGIESMQQLITHL